MESAPARARTARWIELALLALALPLAAAFTWLHWSRNLVHPPASLELLCAFDAEMPYQNRVLVPALLRAFAESGLSELTGVSPLQLALGIEAACVVGFYFALRALLSRFVAGPLRPALWAALGLYALPFVYVLPRKWAYWYPWDLPAVLFTTLGVLWIRDRRWAPYYWLLPFATLNRETAVFLIAVFAATQLGTMKWSAFLAHLAAQAAIWFALKKLLELTFARNPQGVGTYYSKALEDNWALRGEWSSWGTLALVYGFLWLPLAALAPHVREPFVRRALPVVPLFFIVCYVMAQFDEVRVYGEMLPLVVLGVACGAESRRAKRATALSAP